MENTTEPAPNKPQVRGEQFFKTPPVQLLEEIRIMVYKIFSEHIDKGKRRLLLALQGKETQIDLGTARLKEKMKASIDKHFDVFEIFAMRTVFHVPDIVVFQEEDEIDESVIADAVKDPYPLVDVALQDLLARLHLNAQLRARIVKFESDISARIDCNLESMRNRLSQALQGQDHSQDGERLRALLEQTRDMFSDLQVVNTVLMNEGVLVMKRDDKLKQDERQAVGNMVVQGTNELLSLVLDPPH